MRDVAEAGGITDTMRFRKFLVGCASLVAEQVNYSTLAESADIAPSTGMVESVSKLMVSISFTIENY